MPNRKKHLFFGPTVTRREVEEKPQTFEQFAEFCQTCERIPTDSYTYSSLPKARRNQLKDGRYVTACSFVGNARGDAFAKKLELIIIDIDDPSHIRYVDPMVLELKLCDYNWIMYPTLSGTLEQPRYRLIIEADGRISPAHHHGCVATISQLIGLPEVTLESLTVSQPMYLPKRCDGALYECFTHLDGRPFTFEDIDFHAALKVGERQIRSTEGEHYGDDDLLYLIPPADTTDEEVVSALGHVDPDLTYKEWVSIAAGIRHQYQDDEDAGFKIFHEWSQRGEKYTGEEDTLKTWRSLKANTFNRDPVTIRSVFFAAISGGWKPSIDDSDDFAAILHAIDTADTFEVLLRDIPKKISEKRLSEAIRDLLANAVKKRIAQVTNRSVSIVMIRKACEYRGNVSVYKSNEGVWLREDETIPEWARQMFYVRHTNEFYDDRVGERYTPQVLNNAYGKYLITQEDRLDGRTTPSIRPQDALLNVYDVPQVWSYVYLPNLPARIVEFGGAPCINTYKDARPALKRDKELVKSIGDLIESHTEWLFGHKHDQQCLLDFVTYCIQNPGHKINWAILIQGVQGSGKTFYANLIAACLGSQHVGILDNTILNKEWTSWAEGKCVVAIEEVRAVGQSRHAVMDRLKPFITNDTVAIARRGVDEYLLPNVTNYLMFTNHPDALVLDETDRRYCIMRSFIQHTEQIVKRGGEHYYHKLFSILEHPGAIRRYFEQRKISAGFSPKGRAPVTRWRRQMIELNMPDVDVYVRELIERGEVPGVWRDLISSTDLYRFLTSGLSDYTEKVGRKTVSLCLLRLGYEQTPDRVSIKGVKHTLWIDTALANKLESQDNPMRYLVSLYNKRTPVSYVAGMELI